MVTLATWQVVSKESVTAWRKLAEARNTYLEKGSQVLVEPKPS
jgi:single-stranded DNA-binding protein